MDHVLVLVVTVPEVFAGGLNQPGQGVIGICKAGFLIGFVRGGDHIAVGIVSIALHRIPEQEHIVYIA